MCVYACFVCPKQLVSCDRADAKLRRNLPRKPARARIQPGRRSKTPELLELLIEMVSDTGFTKPKKMMIHKGHEPTNSDTLIHCEP